MHEANGTMNAKSIQLYQFQWWKRIEPWLYSRCFGVLSKWIWM